MKDWQKSEALGVDRKHTTTFATGRAFDTNNFTMACAGFGAAEAKMEDPSSSLLS
jgi:hypothetical protein